MNKKILFFVLLCSVLSVQTSPSGAEESDSGSFFHRSRKAKAAKEEAKKEAVPVVVPPAPEKPIEERMVTEGITLPEIQKQEMAEPPPLKPAAFDPDPVPAMPAVPAAPAPAPGSNKGYLVGAPQAPKIQMPPSVPKVPSAPKPPPSPGRK